MGGFEITKKKKEKIRNLQDTAIRHPKTNNINRNILTDYFLPVKMIAIGTEPEDFELEVVKYHHMCAFIVILNLDNVQRLITLDQLYLTNNKYLIFLG